MKKEKLPDRWKWSTLSKECDINPRRPKDLQADDDQETSFVPMEAVDGDLGTIKDIKTVSFSKVKKGYTYFEENDVLFAKITPCMQNKKSAIAKNLINEFGFGTTEFHVLRCKDGVIPEWIYYFIRNQKFVCEAEANFTGSVGHQRVPKTFLEDYPLIVPPLEIQQEIVDKLDKQMAHIEMMKKEAEMIKMTSKNQFLSYLCYYFETDENNMPSGWKLLTLNNLVPNEKHAIKRGPFGSSLTKDIFISAGYKVYEQKNAIQKNFKIGSYYINKEKFEEMIAFKVKKDDVIISCSGTIGEVAIVPKDAEEGIINQALLKITLDNKTILPKYFKYLFESEFTRKKLIKLTMGGAIKNVASVKLLKKIIFPIPPLNQQMARIDEIESSLIKIKQLNENTDNQLNAINQLPESILNEVFGKYELPDEV